MPDTARTHRFSFFLSFAESLRARRGWRRLATAFAAGLVSGLSFPPVNAVPVLWLCFPALIFLLQGAQNWRQAFAVGWSYALGFGLVSFYWIAGALFVDIKQFWWILPFAIAGLPAGIALFYGVTAALAWKIGTRGISGAVSFALFWFLAEYARGHLLTGFPWNLAGYAWAEFLPVLQIVSVIGIYGLTLLTLVIACLPAALAENPPSRSAVHAVFGGLFLIALLGTWGIWRFTASPLEIVADVRLRLVQPNTDQRLKWDQTRTEQNFGTLLDLSAAPAANAPVTHIIWPETAAIFFLEEDPVHRRAAVTVAPPGGALITGIIRRRMSPTGNILFHNSLIVLDQESRTQAVYDKFHLVPFGEYVPFRTLLPMRALTALGIDFTPGPGPRTVKVPGLPAFSPLVCYEAIFPGDVADPAERPQFLLNITNDGWYDHTTGPYQHFAISRVRAVEEGLPLVRVANRGISAVIDSFGRIVTSIGWEKPASIDSDLPQSLPPTLFSRYRDKSLWLLFFLITAAIVVGHTQRRK